MAIDCLGALSRFEEYSVVVLSAQDARKLLPEVTRHLDLCPACATDFRALLDRLLEINARVG
jgi:hypothetical protein